ncbi:malate synthase A [Deinococcus aquiradiocola]|uniref:malate synthase n=1 Tax=Deinococcus aquiradiocola TaxID=393059 RepID=A0A917URW4_9DEIO|nr:malate synthase A [Deinococcus aquiradiocola]GGJ80329.1 malate synthase A [Deinococcus aquiradiocola]
MPADLLSPDAHALAVHLHDRLMPTWEALALPARWTPADLPADLAPLAVDAWRAADVPDVLRERRVELIVAAHDDAAVRHGLKSGADAVVLDLDDVFSPRAGNLRRAYRNFPAYAALPGVFLTRVRPLAHREPRATLNGRAAVAGLLDLAACMTAFRAREVLLYLPKIDSVPEARFWRDALTLAERWLQLPEGRVRVCLQIETLPGLLRAEALLHELRGYAYGLNAGRWDYVFSVVKHLGPHLPAPLPERARLGMNEPSMQAYARQIVSVCAAHGAQAVGGTAAVALTGDPGRDRAALDAVRADKDREAAQGFVAAWAGRTELLGAVRDAFRTPAPPPRPEDHRAAALDLPFAAHVPEEAVRDALGVALAVLGAWLAGVGDVARAGRSEDTATAELARAHLQHWHARGLLDRDAYLHLRREQQPDDAPAARLLDALVLTDTPAAYFPAVAETLFPEAALPDAP